MAMLMTLEVYILSLEIVVSFTVTNSLTLNEDKVEFPAMTKGQWPPKCANIGSTSISSTDSARCLEIV